MPIEMPVYICHKKVHALKVKWIVQHKHQLFKFFIVPDDDSFASIEVSAKYIVKHDPQPGGYYVVYEDGYKSFSPADVFEAGYTLTTN